MRTILLSAAAVAILVGVGLVHGSWINRWQQPEALEKATARLRHFPLRLGDWKGEDRRLTERELRAARVDGHLMRRYECEVDRSVVSMLLLCGRSGPISVHTPDVCYGGAGYDMVGAPILRQVATGSGAPAEFWTAKFRKEGVLVPTYLRIFWAWSIPGERWQAPDNPRLAFARRPALYKLYVVRELSSAEEPLDDDPSLAFLQGLLPQLANGGR